MRNNHPILLTVCLAMLALPAFAQPTISITATDATSAETWPGQTPDTGTLQLTRSGSTTSALTINARLRGTAVFITDYTVAASTGQVLAFDSSVNTTIAFPAGQSSVTLTIAPVDDVVVEIAKTVRVEVLAPNVAGQYLIAGNGRAEVTLTDNDNANTPLQANVNVIALTAAAAEGTNGAPVPGTFRITRNVNTNVTITVAYQGGGSATPIDDYVPLSGNVTIPAGVLFADVIVTPVDDAIYEGNETVTLTLSPSSCPGIFPPPPECYTIGAASNATMTILDNELPPPPPNIVITSPSSNGVATTGQALPVTFTASDADGYIVSYYVSGGSSFSSGVNTNTLPIAPGTPLSGTGSATFNNTYGFGRIYVSVTDNNGNVGSAFRDVWVAPVTPPPPPPPTFATYEVVAVDPEAAETNVGETPNPGKFLITQYGTPGTFQFYFPTFTGTARQGIDYNYAWGATTYSTNGGTNIMTQEVIINPINDYFIEPTETVRLQLAFPIITFIENGGAGAPTGTYYVGDATVNLLDNDTNPPPFSILSVTASDADAAEVSTLSSPPQNPAEFTISRTASTTNALTVNFALAGTALNGVDYETISNSVVIPSGATSVTVAVNPIYDVLGEGNETVQLILRPSPTNTPTTYLIDPSATNFATVIIRDYAPTNIPVVKITVTDAVAVERASVYGGRNARMVVSRTGDLTGSLTVPYDMSGTASNGVDYVALPGTATFTNGASTVPIVIIPIPDLTVEYFDSVVLTLQQPALNVFPPPYLVGVPGSGGATIRDYISYSSRRFSIRYYPRHRYAHTTYLSPTRTFPVPVPTHIVVSNAVTSTVTTNAAPCWIIEASTDMVNWTQIGTSDSTTAAGAVDGFVDTEAGNFSQRFYRTKPCP